MLPSDICEKMKHKNFSLPQGYLCKCVFVYNDYVHQCITDLLEWIVDISCDFLTSFLVFAIYF